MNTSDLLKIDAGKSSALNHRDSIVKSVATKMMRVNSNGTSANTNGTIPTANELSPLVKDAMRDITDAENTLAVLPDIRYAAEVQIASILSSKDLITTSLVFENNSDIPYELKTKLIKYVRDYFMDNLKLQDDLYDIVYDVLYRTGSYALAIIPENAIDKLIDTTVGAIGKEALGEIIADIKRPYGLLGSIETEDSAKSILGIESLLQHDVSMAAPASYDSLKIEFEGGLESIQLIDNPSILKFNKVETLISKQAVANAYRSPMESYGMEDIDATMTHGNVSGYGKKDNVNNAIITELPSALNLKSASVGHPLVYHFPSESFIPIHVPGNPKQIVGGIAIIDGKGNAVSKNDLINCNMAWNWINGDAGSNVKETVASGLGLKEYDPLREMTVSQLTNSFAEIVEHKVKQAINNGTYNGSVEIARPEDVYRITLGRLLAKRHTQMLFVPADQMVYYAVDYNRYGMGRSLLDATKMLSTIRTALQFATLNGSILNSTRHQEVNIALDPNDREGEKTIEDAKYRISQQFNSSSPFTGTPDDMWAMMNNAGVSISVDGNEFYPTEKITISDNSPDYKIPDQSTVDDAARNHYRALCIDPDLIITPQAIEYASQVTSKNLMQVRQICLIQDRLRPLITKHVQVYLRSDGELLNGIADIIQAHIKAEKGTGVLGRYIRTFIDNTVVSLPKPNTGILNSQLEMFDDYATGIDKILEAQLIDESSSDGSVDISRTRALAKSYLLMQWLRDNDVAPEILKLFDDVEGYNEFTKQVVEASAKGVALSAMLIKSTDERIKALLEKLDITADNSSDNSGGWGGDDDDAGTDSSSGEDDPYGFDDDSDPFSDDEDDTNSQEAGDTDPDANTDTDADDVADDNIDTDTDTKPDASPAP